MMEKYGIVVIAVGSLLGLIAFLWLDVQAFRAHAIWGLVRLLFPPAAILFGVLHLRRATGPLVVLLAGVLLIGGTLGLSYYLSEHASLGPRERIVGGELHLTLTGWDRTDYSVLRMKLETVVLQMANPDVTDETLQYLEGMSRLRELDPNDSQITDAGLPLLSKLPALRILRLRGTRISDEAFREHLAGKETLLELDLRQTASSMPRCWTTSGMACRNASARTAWIVTANWWPTCSRNSAVPRMAAAVWNAGRLISAGRFISALHRISGSSAEQAMCRESTLIPMYNCYAVAFLRAPS